MKKPTFCLIGFLICCLLQGCVATVPVQESPTSSQLDPVEESPVATRPVIAEETAPPLQITYDHALLSSREIEVLGEEKYAFYQELVQGVLQYKTRIPIPEKFRRDESFHYVLNLFQKHCPLSYLSGTPYLSLKGDYVLFEYLFSKEIHEEKIKQLEQRVKEIVKETVRERYNLLEASLSIYRYLAATTAYNMGAASTETYGVLMNQEGICTGFAYTMALLLRQAGYDDGYVLAYTPEDPEQEGHAWNALYFNGNWYHVDATWENSGSGGMGLQYFGVTDAQRENEGLMKPFNRDLLEEGTLFVPICTDESLVPLQTAIRYETDFSNHLLYLQESGGDWIAFHTDTLKYESTEEPLLPSK